jgi:hypothetical protein
MKNRFYYATAFFTLFCIANLKAQDAAQVRTDVLTKQESSAAPGTYQFIVISGIYQEPFSNDILKTIERNRHDKQDTFLALSPGIKVRIPSRETIESPAFIPLAEVVYQYNNLTKKK